MQTKDLALQDELCPIRHALNIVGGKWKLPILCLLAAGEPTRYGAIKRRLKDITNMMLSQSLKELEAQGMVLRRQYNEIPPRVEYTLTEAGKSLLPVLEMLAQWGAAHMQETSEHSVHCEQCQQESLATVV